MERSDRGVLVAFSDALADAVERAGEATVRVDARSRFAASGLAYADDLVLTADHVIERDEGIIVGRPDGTEVAADLVGRDPGSDLALLRLREGRLLPAEPVTDEARVGQFTLALGRPTAEGIQASLGIISVVGGPVRTRRGGLLERYIRTDAISYPGFSGGPLVDGEGRVVGINTSGLTMGASLAIPVAQAWQTARDLLDHGRVRRAYLGVRSQPVELAAAQRETLGRGQETGLLIVWVGHDTPAEQGGLMVGDILVAMDGRPVGDTDELQGILLTVGAGHEAQIQVLRGGKSVLLPVRVGEHA